MSLCFLEYFIRVSILIWRPLIWARLTGLARLPWSRLTSKSFVKFSMCSYERAAWSVSGLENFCHTNTTSRLPEFFAIAINALNGRWRSSAVSSHNKAAQMASFCFADEFYTSLATRLTAVIQLEGLPKPW